MRRIGISVKLAVLLKIEDERKRLASLRMTVEPANSPLQGRSWPRYDYGYLSSLSLPFLSRALKFSSFDRRKNGPPPSPPKYLCHGEAGWALDECCGELSGRCIGSEILEILVPSNRCAKVDPGLPKSVGCNAPRGRSLSSRNKYQSQGP